MGWLDSLTGGIKNLFGGAAQGIGNIFGGGQQAVGGATPSGASKYMSFAQNPIGPFQGSVTPQMWSGGKAVGSVAPYAQPTGIASLFNKQVSPPSTAQAGGFGNIFKSAMGSKWALPAAGLGMMGLSQMVKNPGMPEMPEQYNEYLSQMMGGGNPYMQQAGGYYQGLMSGDQDNEYLRSILFPIEESETEEQRQMDAMYKSLRPGTDPMSDSAYQRDKQKLSQKYADTKQRAVAQAKFGAAQGLGGLGTQLGQLQAGALGPQLEMLAAQWGMNASQKQQLRDMLLQGGLGMAMAPIQNQQFLNQLQMMKAIM